jgi:hypothetical protein
MSSAGKRSVVFSFWDLTVVTSNCGNDWGAADTVLVVSWRQEAQPKDIAKITKRVGVLANFIMSP